MMTILNSTRWVRFVTGIVVMVAALPYVSAQEESLLDRWEETLRYGIDSEVESVLEQIGQSGETQLDEQIVTRFAETRNDDLRTAIVEHFESQQSPVLGDEVRALLLSDEMLDNDLLRGSATYLSRVVEDQSSELLERYGEIALDGDLLAASTAIDAIGRNGSVEAVGLLLELYERLSSTDLKAAIVRALGETGNTDAVPLLTMLASDDFQDSSLRQYAAESLGRIGSPESLPLLTELLSVDDAVLRAYATHAIGFYESEEAGELLEEALRDSFWRVRVSALRGLAEQGRVEAIPAIAYKARRDPEQPVREQAIKTLGRLEGEASASILRDLALEEKAAEPERMLAVRELARANPGASIETFAEILREEWEREGSRLLDTVGRALSEYPSPTVEPIYAKLLTHPNYIIRIYGMRGIGGAGIADQADAMKRVARENPSGLVRRTALAALADLGIEYDPDADGDVEDDDEDEADEDDAPTE